jgi:hypothetical protein
MRQRLVSANGLSRRCQESKPHQRQRSYQHQEHQHSTTERAHRDWTDPTGSRSHIGALLLGYYTEDGHLHYAGRAGTGMTEKELRRLAGVLAPLRVPRMPLAEPPPRDSRFGSPLKLSRVHWFGQRWSWK